MNLERREHTVSPLLDLEKRKSTANDHGAPHHPAGWYILRESSPVSDAPEIRRVRMRAAGTRAKTRIRIRAMFRTIEDLRIKWTKVVLPPVFLEEELPITEASSETIDNARAEISAILAGRDRRLLVLVGPCSIHDTEAARAYAGLLKSAIAEFSADLRIVMRVYFEKPRTTIGWKGLINDPHLDQSYKINDGLRLARHLLLDLAEMGVPTGTEFLDMISPQYVAGLVSWGAIGARTTESQVHRELVSGVSCPVGFKNATSGDVQVAIDAILSAAHSHTFLGHTKYGQSAIFVTTGNPDCHIILRGGTKMVNYTAECVDETAAKMVSAGLQPRIMIDFSHANSNKDYRRQALVCHDVAAQIAAGNRNILGVMIESNLVAGAQKLVPGQPLVYGQSVTDGCIDWAETHSLLAELAAAVRARHGA
jgi:3-deoxy-7-phosphoheptulonate synthase